MMKQIFVAFALVGLAFSAPQPRKVFHENVEDFMTVIIEEVGDEIEHLMEHYLEFEEFTNSLQYLKANDFKDLIYEMESLPEFVAVLDFLENSNIDIYFIIDFFNKAIENQPTRKHARHSVSGTDMTAFIDDCIALFPKDKLSALYDEKMANDEEFSTAMNSLASDEWEQVFDALWQSETFQNEVATLNENGIDVHAILREIKAIFGQN